MATKTIQVKLKGMTPLCMHSPQASDALCQHPCYAEMRKIATKRTKTEEDHLELARLEWMLSLYIGKDGNIMTPGRCWEAAFKDTAKRQKLGKKFNASVMVEDAPLVFPDASKTPEELWESKKYFIRQSMKVGTARVMRTTPHFPEWSVTLTVRFMDSEVDEQTLRSVIRDCGIINGSFEFRPRYGRFEVIE
jgi:hypothetical protein